MIRLFRLAILILLVVVFAGGGAVEAATLDVDGDGNLLGAFDVDVNGTLYDVAFLDGNCITLFSGCDEPVDFTFATEALALAASQALLDQVLIDVGGDFFDSVPELTNGCSAPGICSVLTGSAEVHAPTGDPLFAIAENTGILAPLPPDSILSGPIPADGSLPPGFDEATTYAIWSAVPEPEPTMLLGLGFGLIAMRRHRARAA